MASTIIGDKKLYITSNSFTLKANTYDLIIYNGGLGNIYLPNVVNMVFGQSIIIQNIGTDNLTILTQAPDLIKISDQPAINNYVLSTGGDLLFTANNINGYWYISGKGGSSVLDTNTPSFGTNAGKINQGVDSVAIGTDAGYSNQGERCVAIGYRTAVSNQRNNSVCIGWEAGAFNQDLSSVAIGVFAGQNNQGNSSVALGDQSARYNQLSDATAVGNRTGHIDQKRFTVAVGAFSGYNNQGEAATAVGYLSGHINQMDSTVAIGNRAGQNGQQSWAIAVGLYSGYENQEPSAVAVGPVSGHLYQKNSAVAVGIYSGYSNQQTMAIGIGRESGVYTQGRNSIAIGYRSGYNNQASNSIIINATGNVIDNTNINTIKIAPIRDISGGATNVLRYDTSTNEVYIDVATSDQRIKKNIENLSDSECLEIVKNIEPKKYEYIDNHIPGTVYGFIAQEVEQQLPYAVTTATGFIPNIYASKHCYVLSETIINDSENPIPPNDVPVINIKNTIVYKKYNLKCMFIQQDLIIGDIIQLIIGQPYNAAIINIETDHIVIELICPDLKTDETDIFFYGKKVTDFKGLNKDLLLPILWSAVQQLSRLISN
jgi:hypothetical protein